MGESRLRVRRTIAVIAASVGAALAVATAGASAAGRCGTYAWCNTQLSPDQRATMLFDTNCRLVADPDRDARLLWSRIGSRRG